MAKAWKDVIASPQYQALSPDQQAAAQEQYFNEVVAPKAGPQADAAKQQFYSAYPSAVTQQQQPSTMWQNQQPGQQGGAWGDQQPITRAEAMGNAAVEAGKGLLQSGANVANIPAEIMDAFKSAGAWAAGQLGLSDGTYQPTQRLELPQELQPQDSYAKLGAEIGPYLIPGLGAERTAAALGSVAGAGRAERLATQGGNILAENLPGVLAQNSQRDDAGSFAGDLATGAAGSVVGRGIVRGAGAVASRVSEGVSGVREWANSLRPAAMESSPAARTADDVAQSIGTADPAAAIERAASYGKVAESGDKGRIAQVINDIQPDQQVIAASQRLGIDPDSLLEAYISGNEAFKVLQIGLASQDASVLAAVKRESIERISRRASKIIDDAGAMRDRLEVNNKFRYDFDTTRKALVKQENELFQPVNDAIPARAPVDPANTRAYLDNLADDLGGAEHLSTVEKWVYDKIAPSGSDAGAPTYARLNAARARVGADLGKANTPFGSAEERNLSQLYANLSRDRDAVADAYGFTDQIKAANAVTVQRKIMEDRVYNLLGKDMTGDVTAAANTALNGLSTGNSQKFRQLMRSIPDKEMRKQVIATGMRDMLRKGTRSDLADNINGFVDYYGALKRNGNVKMLASVLPKGSMQRMEDFYTLTRNVKSANRYHLQTGKLSSFLQSFEQPNGFLDKLATHGKMATIATVLGQVPVVGPVLNTSVAAQMGAKAATKKTGAQAVQDLMVSSEWKRLSAAARGNPSPSAQQKIVQGADGRISRTEAWKEFYRTLPRAEKDSIARLGIIGWLSGGDNEDKQ
ncbi:hypothetical protein [Pectobacterium brasiliense]|uniref:hypothetical protein n=1 Tax=Pectobacterium brasiliense TaxID=180957 RepID=UPI00068E28C1|nr:hypothetical protein [Pectobacterium brasiliense]